MLKALQGAMFSSRLPAMMKVSASVHVGAWDRSPGLRLRQLRPFAGDFRKPNSMEERTVFQPSVAGSVKPGARLNGIYEIETLIAQGGMGEVYRGFNIQTRHQVAIKMIRPEYSNDPETLSLFRREALTLNNLTHEAIVRYFVFSVDPDLGRAYLAMEFVDGPSLTKRLVSGALPLEEIKVLQRQLASALQTAHEHGVIHRDISPDNIILPDEDVRHAKIVDFGIARSVHPTEVSIIGSRFAGKYNFASPEQFGLAGGEVTFKSDIYSLGLVLAAALRGRPIDMSGTQVEGIAKRCVVPDLSDIDPAIRPLIQAMLQPLPANRPPSMGAVASWEGTRRLGLVLPRAAGKAMAAREPAGGRTAAFLGALIALASIGGATYVFRDDLARWGQSVIGPAAPLGPAKLPPISEPEARPSTPPAPSPPETKPAEALSAATGSPSATPTPPVEPQTSASPPPAAEAAQPPRKQHETSAPPSGSPQEEKHTASVEPPIASERVAVLAATAGVGFVSNLPRFNADANSAGLLLHAEPDAPPGLAFADLGFGSSRLFGTPMGLGSYTFDVVATDPAGQSGRMKVRLVVSPPPAASQPTVAPPPAPGPLETKPAEELSAATATPTPPVEPQTSAPPLPAAEAAQPPRKEHETSAPPSGSPQQEKHTASVEPPIASEPVAVLAATAGVRFVSNLPRFNAGADSAGLLLHAVPDAPPGLAFADLGFGSSRLSGTPMALGSYVFDVVATNPAGQSGRMKVRLVVSPPPPPSQSQ